MTGHDGERQAGIDERLAEFRLRRGVMIDMHRVGILCQQREPDVVGGKDGAAERMLVDITHFEILEYPSRPRWFHGYRTAPELLRGFTLSCTKVHHGLGPP